MRYTKEMEIQQDYKWIKEEATIDINGVWLAGSPEGSNGRIGSTISVNLR